MARSGIADMQSGVEETERRMGVHLSLPPTRPLALPDLHNIDKIAITTVQILSE